MNPSEVVVFESIVSSDVAVIKEELFDAEFARQLVNDKNIPKDDRAAIRRFAKSENTKGHKHTTYYKLGKNCKNDFLGRLCALKGEGLQCFSRDIRAALTQKYYWDVDMVNAQPTILVQYCQQRGWSCDAVKRYVAQREELLSEIIEKLSIERWEAKERIISIFFGSGNVEDLPEFFKEELYPEVRKVMSNIWNERHSELKWLEKQPNRTAKGMAHILQTEERNCLLAMEKALAGLGRSLDVYIHDGGLVRKKDDEKSFPTSILRSVEKEVERLAGYSITLALKPIETSFVREGDEDDDYLELKTKFEETGWKGAIHFKLRDPAAFVMIRKNGISLLTKSELLQNEEDNLCSNGSSFIKRWLEDPTKREYNELIYYPSLTKEFPGCFNLFKGFAVEPKAGANIEPIHQLVRMLSNNDERMFDYIQKWVAHIVQKPYEKTKTALIVIGSQGVGKDTYFNFVGDLLGKQYFHNTSSPENDIFGRFNGGTEQSILIKFEEANFQTNKNNADQLKSLITSDTRNFEYKGKKPINLDSFSNIVMTTNHEVPVVLEEGERRFVITHASNEKRGDLAYWNELYEHLGKQEVKEAYLHYLMTLDISTFTPKDRVLNEAYADVKQSFIPYHARWFQEVLEEDCDIDRDLSFNARVLYNSMRDSKYVSYDLKETKFGLDMRAYVAAGIFMKEHRRTGAWYTIKREALREYLVSKSWWVEL